MPPLVFITGDLCHDMHGGDRLPIGHGHEREHQGWRHVVVDRATANPHLRNCTHDSVVYLIWDEGSTNQTDPVPRVPARTSRPGCRRRHTRTARRSSRSRSSSRRAPRLPAVASANDFAGMFDSGTFPVAVPLKKIELPLTTAREIEKNMNASAFSCGVSVSVVPARRSNCSRPATRSRDAASLVTARRTVMRVICCALLVLPAACRKHDADEPRGDEARVEHPGEEDDEDQAESKARLLRSPASLMAPIIVRRAVGRC